MFIRFMQYSSAGAVIPCDGCVQRRTQSLLHFRIYLSAIVAEALFSKRASLGHQGCCVKFWNKYIKIFKIPRKIPDILHNVAGILPVNWQCWGRIPASPTAALVFRPVNVFIGVGSPVQGTLFQRFLHGRMVGIYCAGEMFGRIRGRNMSIVVDRMSGRHAGQAEC